MAEYEAVCGIAESDPCYAYIATRPRLKSEHLCELSKMTQYAKYLDLVITFNDQSERDETELEFRSTLPLNPERMTRIALMLGGIVRVDSDEIALLPGCINIEGAEPLFAQYDKQMTATTMVATQTS